MTNLIVYCKKGAALKPGSLVPAHAHHADYVSVEDGDAVGHVMAKTPEARRLLEADPNITVLPPPHRPLTLEHAKAFAHVDAKEGEMFYDVAERLAKHHKMPWFHPEYQ
jgi:hypothetical protein